MYRLLRPLLFWLPAETSHHLTFLVLRFLYRIPGIAWLTRFSFLRHTPALPVTAMRLHFRNPIGLAAGLDKNGEHIQALSDFGFGFLELGTVTPRPQPGNPQPRLFRLPTHGALINRMGFNSAGLAAFIKNVSRRHRPCPIGINLGKNKDTPNDRAIDDYLQGLRAVYSYADYVAINISSPNTPGLRELQSEENLDGLLRALKSEQTTLTKTHERYVPIALKLAPDLSDAQIATIAGLVRLHQFDAVIATNTTVSRPGLEDTSIAKETGGLSGRPLKDLSTRVIRELYRHLQGKIPIIGVGGIENAEDAWEKLLAGADLIQLYTTLIYQGPGIVKDVVQGLSQKVVASGKSNLAEAITQTRKLI